MEPITDASKVNLTFSKASGWVRTSPPAAMRYKEDEWEAYGDEKVINGAYVRIHGRGIFGKLAVEKTDRVVGLCARQIASEFEKLAIRLTEERHISLSEMRHREGKIHPYAHTIHAWGPEAIELRAHPYIINCQSGSLLRHWYSRATKTARGWVARIGNTSPDAYWVSGNPTSLMIARPIKEYIGECFYLNNAKAYGDYKLWLTAKDIKSVILSSFGGS